MCFETLGKFRQVLIERSAAGHIENLYAAADGDKGLFLLQHELHQRQLKIVQKKAGRPHKTAGKLSVFAGRDILPSAEEKAVADSKILGKNFPVLRYRQHDGNAAAAADRAFG